MRGSDGNVEIGFANCQQLCKSLAKMIRKTKTPREWILYANVERDPIPAAMLAIELPGTLVAAASPMVINGLGPRIVRHSILFSVIADKTLFDIWNGINVLRFNVTTAAFFKTLDDTNLWLDILPRGEVRMKW